MPTGGEDGKRSLGGIAWGALYMAARTNKILQAVSTVCGLPTILVDDSVPDTCRERLFNLESLLTTNYTLAWRLYKHVGLGAQEILDLFAEDEEDAR